MDKMEEQKLDEADLLKTSSSFKGAYVKKSDTYKDLKGSAFCLIIVGLIGYVYLALNFTGVIGQKPEGITGILFLLAMGTLFTVFFTGGIMALIKSNKVKSEIASEENTTKTIIKHFNAELMDKINSQISGDLDEGSLYFRRADLIKNEIIQNFGELDDQYIELIIEDIYSNVYE